MAKVMVVDDSQFMRLTIQTMLVAGHHEVVAQAENGPQAVEQYKKYRPEVVTMDIIMPVASGLEAVSQIIKFDPAARILMVSAMGQEKIVQDAMRLGAKGFLGKPVKAIELLEKISQSLK